MLKAVGISKRFPGVIALVDVDFELREGEVHGLVGTNGAGKTTFLSILNGIIKADKGEIYLYNKKIELHNPKSAWEHGIFLVRQLPLLFPNLRVVDNVMICQETTKRLLGLSILDTSAMTKYVASIFEQLQFSLPLTLEASMLTPSQEKFIEIARALASDSRIICFDEPTSAMNQAETEHFFEVIKDLKKKGKSVIYVTHRMPEVFTICDRVTVFRDGRKVCTMDISEISPSDVVEAMTGKREFRVEKKTRYVGERTVLKVVDLFTEPTNVGEVALKGVSFQIRHGEIVAVTGVVGAGKTELAKTLMGMTNLKQGYLVIGNEKLKPKSPSEMVKRGFVYLPEDFMSEGLFPNWAVEENISILSLDDFLNFLGVINRKREKEAVKNQIKAFSIKPPDLGFPVMNLSGGNKKKVILARGVLRKPKVLILDEPTMGIDVASKAELRTKIQEIAQNGISVLIFSTDLEDTLIADEILVMRDGKIVATLEGSEATIEKITEFSTGVK